MREVAVFEVGMCQHPKAFATISRLIGSKTTSDVVAFYYTTWKHSAHYWRWKRANTATAEQATNAVDARTPRVEIVLDDEESEERQPEGVAAQSSLVAAPSSSAAAATLLSHTSAVSVTVRPSPAFSPAAAPLLSRKSDEAIRRDGRDEVASESSTSIAAVGRDGREEERGEEG